MKIITIQSEEIFDILKESGIYHCSFISEYNESTPLSYNHLANKLTAMGKPCDIPIFAWSKVIDDEINMSVTSLLRMNEMTPFKENTIILELEVSDDELLLTDFYNFVDMRYSEEFPKGNPNYEEISTTWEDVFNIRRDVEIQAILPYIKHEWVKNAYHYSLEYTTPRLFPVNIILCTDI
jgi:hypothetical protein